MYLFERHLWVEHSILKMASSFPLQTFHWCQLWCTWSSGWRFAVLPCCKETMPGIEAITLLEEHKITHKQFWTSYYSEAWACITNFKILCTYKSNIKSLILTFLATSGKGGRITKEFVLFLPSKCLLRGKRANKKFKTIKRFVSDSGVSAPFLSNLHISSRTPLRRRK